MNDYKNLSDKEFYFIKKRELDYFSNLGKIPGLLKKKINPSAILSILRIGHLLDTQTTIENIFCSSWMMTKISNTKNNTIILPKHDKKLISVDKISEELKKRLINEALEFVKDKSVVGVLLSGGMDSRVVASVIRELQISGKYMGKVVVLSWGLKNSRDVAYSQRVAKLFAWEYRYFKLSPQMLKENIILAGERGAMYSPVHLHAMKEVSETKGLDGILAGSYGDMVGRAEFSGVKVQNLPNLLKKNLNSFAFMLNDAQKDSFKDFKNIFKISRSRVLAGSEQDYREIDMHIHYTRRLLNSCMQVINEKIPLYQMFTSPTVYGFMWSLDYNSRTDEIYKFLLKKLPGNLLEIPWARTGKKFNKSSSLLKDDLIAKNNLYGYWLRNDLREFVIEKILNGNLQKIGIFNKTSLKLFCKNWKKDGISTADRLDQQMAWLASLSIFVEKYDIQPNFIYKKNIKDIIEELKAKFYYFAYYNVRKFLRK